MHNFLEVRGNDDPITQNSLQISARFEIDIHWFELDLDDFKHDTIAEGENEQSLAGNVPAFVFESTNDLPNMLQSR